MAKKNTPLHKFAEFVVNRYKLFFIIFAALCVFSAFSMNWTEVENDVAAYLPDSYEAKQGLDIMDEEFKTYGSAKILVEDIDDAQASEINDEIEAVSGVESCEYSMNDSGSALFKVSLSSLEGEGEDTVDNLRDMFSDENAYIYSEEGYSLSDQITGEVRGLIVIIGVILVVVLTFTSSTYAEVPILLATFLAAALINKGTNFMLGEISFISNSVTIILQLAMSVDYAIIFCYRYKQAHKTMPVREAVVDSLASSVVVISSSSLTTIAGLFAMTFMKFGIGKDMGVALIKAIVISLLSVFLLMPGLLLKLGDAMDKTKHRNFVPKISAVGSFAYKARRVVPVVFLVVIALAYVGSENVNYAYSDTMLETVKQSENKIAENEMRSEFNDENTLAIVVPNGDYDTEEKLIESLSEIDEVGSITGVAGIEVMDGYKLFGKLTYSQFADLAGVDSTSAQALFALYAAENGDQETAAENLSSYEAPLIKLFLLLNEKINDGTVELTDSQAELVSDLNHQLSFATDQLEGENYDRIILTLNVVDDGDETFELLDRIHAIVAQYYPDDSYLVGNAMTAYSFKETFTQDNIMVSVMSIVMVMLVLLFTFKSVGMPILLTLVIQGSIWINFGLTVISDRHVLFMVYLVASAIQMGCNVDYAIVVASHYNEERAMGLKPREAMINAMNLAFPTIITSGTALISAGLLIGAMVSSGSVAGMGHFVGIGSLITVFLVLFVLPALLIFGDGLIRKTEFHIHAKNPHLLMKRIAAWGLALAIAFVMVATPWVWLSGKTDYDERISDDEAIVSSAQELGELAVLLDAQKEKYDEAKLGYAESVVTDNIGQSRLNQGQAQYDAGASELAAAKAQYAQGQEKLEQGKAEYAEGQKKLEDAKTQYAEGEAKLEKIKPIYDMVQPAYQRYLDMKAQYDEAVANGERAKAALLWPSVEAQKLAYENQIAGTGYSIESIVQQYEDGQRQLSEGAAQITEAEQQLAEAAQQLEDGQKQLDEAAAQIAAGQVELDEAGEELESGRATLSENKAKLTQELSELDSYSDDLERLEHGVAALMSDDEISSRAGNNASYADICSVAEEHYSNDITRAERENNIRTIICALILATAVISLICALLYKKRSQTVAVLAALSAIISGGCAIASAILGSSVILTAAALVLMLATLLFGEIYLKRSNKK
jgi:uncharacterized protein